jgi:hypothetical protein
MKFGRIRNTYPRIRPHSTWCMARTMNISVDAIRGGIPGIIRPHTAMTPHHRGAVLPSCRPVRAASRLLRRDLGFEVRVKAGLQPRVEADWIYSA